MMKNKFRVSGAAFLSAEAEDFEARLVRAHQPFFEVFNRASVAAYDVLARLTVDRTDRIQLYGACAFARLCEACQAAAYLAARGFVQETAVEIRIALEVLLKFKAALIDPQLTNRIIDADLLEQRKLGNILLDGEVSQLTSENRSEVEARQVELDRKIAETKAKRLPTEQLARKVDALGLYHTVYRLTSSHVHISPRSLTRYMKLDETGQPDEIVFGPSDTDVDVHLHTVTEFLLIAISLLDRHKGFEPPGNFESISEDFRSLEPEWSDDEPIG